MYVLYRDANRYQKVVGQNGRGKELQGLSDTSKNLLFEGYFCPEQGLSAMNFRGGAKKW